MIDAFAESQGIAMDTVHCKAIFGKGFFLIHSSFMSLFRYL